MNTLKMKLTADQTEDLPFPVGCQVWYNFPEKSNNESKQPPILKHGIVESVSLNLVEKDMIYEVVYRDEDNGETRTIAEEISEHKLAYGNNCPVTVSTVDQNADESDNEGTVLFCEVSPSDPHKFLYTVVIPMEGSRARFESRVDAERVKYRKVAKAGIISAASSVAASSRKEQPVAAIDHTPPPKISASASALSPDEVAVPSSITCDFDGMLEIKTPFWLQRDRSTQTRLFFHLIGSKHPDKRGNRTVNDIGHETNCDVRVNFKDDGDEVKFRHPITVSVTARSRSSGARDVHAAREKIQDLLLDYVQRDGSRGRLVYDVAYSCPGTHRPQASRACCVRAKDPFAEDDREVFMTLVHLPFEQIKGKKEFHVDFLLTSSLLNHLWKEMDCYVKAACNRSGIPVYMCWPYLLVMGKTWRGVDRAVDTLKEVMKKHVDRCSCKYNALNNS